MPGKLRKGAKCWSCGEPVIVAIRTTHCGRNWVTIEFSHHKRSTGWRRGPCEMEMSEEEGERAMKGLSRRVASSESPQRA